VRVSPSGQATACQVVNVGSIPTTRFTFLPTTKGPNVADDTMTRLYRDSDYGSYPTGSQRLDKVYEWIVANVPENTDVLDYGSGRGYLLRKLLPLNRYRCHAWDACTWVREHDLAELTGAAILQLPPGFEGKASFDCVVSSDVLEHLPNNAAAMTLLERLVAMSRKWVVLTVGCGHSNARANIPGLDVELHSVLHSAGWWKPSFEHYLDIVDECSIIRSYCVLGTKKAMEA
jgi:hypothetical protein